MLRMVKMSEKSPAKSIIDELPSGVKNNLISGETVVSYLKTFEIVERPNYIILTNQRVLFFDEKMLWRYAFKSLPLEKMLQLRANRGAVLWGDISFKMEDGTVVLLEKVDRDKMKGFIDAFETAYNKIAVEPISIKHNRNLLDRETWEFNKPSEILFRGPSSNQPETSESKK